MPASTALLSEAILRNDDGRLQNAHAPDNFRPAGSGSGPTNETCEVWCSLDRGPRAIRDEVDVLRILLGSH